jgi:hypothetical protein
MGSEASIRALMEKALTKRPSTVAELAHEVTANGALSEPDFVQAVKDMMRDKSLVLSAPAYEIESPLDYLFTITLSGWLWAAFGVTAISLIIVTLTPDAFPLVVPRWIMGSIFVLYLPGYSLLQLLFPKGSELDSLERFALNIGVSLAVVPLIGLVLNFTPLGIRLIPIILSLALFTTAASIGAATRKYWMVRI